MQKINIMIAASIVLVATSATADVVLLRQNATLRSNVDGLRSELRVQLDVPLERPINGLNVAGAPLSVDFKPISRLAGRSEPRIVFVLSPECKFCATNWANWHHLLTERNPGLEWQPVFVNIGPALDADYLQRHEMTGSMVFQSISTDTALAYKMYSTPQTILVDGAGRARGVWQGTLSPRQMAEIRELLQRPDISNGAAEHK